MVCSEMSPNPLAAVARPAVMRRIFGAIGPLTVIVLAGFVALAELRAATNVPLAADESVRDLRLEFAEDDAASLKTAICASAAVLPGQPMR